ncbi:hypothetical protein RclHR1_04170005 [Rhizophagus clarus]|uniref:Uncharacterized protein n=1 Tax=Rhizophagus clarus TaxID=94130 RepID=A0A2Z6RWL0_9GLOM|nr:hypothetical protein RclHR1_04170005 [Rhizophagus clarus]
MTPSDTEDEASECTTVSKSHPQILESAELRLAPMKGVTDIQPAFNYSEPAPTPMEVNDLINITTSSITDKNLTLSSPIRVNLYLKDLNMLSEDIFMSNSNSNDAAD